MRDLACFIGAAQPVRDGTRDAVQIGLQRGIVFQVIPCVIADHVDDAGAALPRVMQVGPAVRETGAEVQKRARDIAAHPGIAVGGPGHAALEEAENAAHVRMRVQRGDEVHLGRAGIGETDGHTGCKHRFDKRFGAVHVFSQRCLVRGMAEKMCCVHVESPRHRASCTQGSDWRKWPE